MSGVSTWRVPGRVEVLGKHTDYGGGRVLVCAVERSVTVTARAIPPTAAGAASGGVIDASSDHYPDPVRLVAHQPCTLPSGHWGHYVQTVIDRLTSNFGPLGSARLTISSDLPPASGMSSSSALLTGVMLTLADLNDLPVREEWTASIHDRLDLAGYAASIENGKSFRALKGHPGVGTSGGSLDHTGMLTSAPGRLSYVEFDPARIVTQVALPPEYSLVIGVSGVLAEKTGSARDLYNRGPRTLAAILERWNAEQGRSDASLHAAVRSLGVDGAPPGQLALDRRLTPLMAAAEPGYPTRRLTQFLMESTVLVPAAAQALSTRNIARFGDIVARSQALATTHLGNQVPQTTALVRLALAMGAPAASAFGAGFGGSVWALVPTTDAPAFATAWLAAYTRRFTAPGASTIVTRPGAAAERLG